MTKLTFKSSEGLQTLAEQTLKTTFFKMPYTNETTKEKGLWLVKDEGIYLMKAFAVSEKDMPIVYAESFDPYKDEDVWDRSVDAVGGDDFAMFLPFSEAGLNLMKKGVDTCVEYTDKYIEVTYSKE
tara:strand:- start:7 stop:384 length:378 start_codon:yes stop_codon:yes gene_type:complete